MWGDGAECGRDALPRVPPATAGPTLASLEVYQLDPAGPESVRGWSVETGKRSAFEAWRSRVSPLYRSCVRSPPKPVPAKVFRGSELN
jgi:hypothetical protein